MVSGWLSHFRYMATTISRHTIVILVNLDMQQYTFTAQIERDNEAGGYTASVPALPGAHTQAQSLEELWVNLKEVIELCMEELTEDEIGALSVFIGFQQITIEK